MCSCAKFEVHTEGHTEIKSSCLNTWVVSKSFDIDTYGSHASTPTYKKYPYCQPDTEEGRWERKVSCEDQVPVSFEHRVAQRPALLSPACPRGSCAQGGAAVTRARRQGPARPRPGPGPALGNLTGRRSIAGSKISFLIQGARYSSTATFFRGLRSACGSSNTSTWGGIAIPPSSFSDSNSDSLPPPGESSDAEIGRKHFYKVSIDESTCCESFGEDVSVLVGGTVDEDEELEALKETAPALKRGVGPTVQNARTPETPCSTSYCSTWKHQYQVLQRIIKTKTRQIKKHRTFVFLKVS
ncbi:hypothetical protein DV515_00002955 [Chloebia gouldiae]|uniref:Uncharacterized protein n=1 Tax=Chloebia gouldiae TaxID=44316 RepID=A0A3L8SV48_CHLGU|nr:hypothetical protein DV515_00002955 [Chloebia gouldiae]